MGGGWLLDFTRLMQSHLSTKVEVEVEDELGNEGPRYHGSRAISKTLRGGL